jgi:hypothetical protein
MRNYILLFITLALFTSCSEEDQEVSFYIPTEIEYTIPSSSAINLPFNILTPEVETNAQAEFSSNNTRANLIKEVELSNLSFEILNPEGEDFSFLSSITVFIAAEGLPEVEVASSDNINPNTNKLVLQTTDLNLQDYLKKETYTMRINTITDEVLTQDHRLEIKSQFFVLADLVDS